MQVSVYKNLNKGCLSIRACEGPHKGRVIAHASDVALSAVRFHVGKSGQTRVQKTGHKNVHAFVTGSLIGWQGEPFGVGRDFLQSPSWSATASVIGRESVNWPSFTYNPYRDDGFVKRGTSDIIEAAHMAYLNSAGDNRANVITYRETAA